MVDMIIYKKFQKTKFDNKKTKMDDNECLTHKKNRKKCAQTEKAFAKTNQKKKEKKFSQGNLCSSVRK